MTRSECESLFTDEDEQLSELTEEDTETETEESISDEDEQPSELTEEDAETETEETSLTDWMFDEYFEYQSFQEKQLNLRTRTHPKNIPLKMTKLNSKRVTFLL